MSKNKFLSRRLVTVRTAGYQFIKQKELKSFEKSQVVNENMTTHKHQEDYPYNFIPKQSVVQNPPRSRVIKPITQKLNFNLIKQ